MQIGGAFDFLVTTGARPPSLASVRWICLAGLALAASPAGAGDLEAACLARTIGAAELCHCIQGVANRTLSHQDQSRVVKLFADPEVAEEVRMSRKTRDKAFWDRYERFGAEAAKRCS